jgi:xenotropic and polytropic retrovirus receptor 1
LFSLEWRIKYLNYKAGKKYVKGVSRAIQRANFTPHSRRGDPPPRTTPSTANAGTPYVQQRSLNLRAANDADGQNEGHTPRPMGFSTPARAAAGRDERDVLSSSGDNLHYGSFVPTPPRQMQGTPDDRQSFRLPGPAIGMPANASQPSLPLPGSMRLDRIKLNRSASMAAAVPSVSRNANDPLVTPPSTLPRPAVGAVGRTNSINSSQRLGIRRLFSHASPLPRSDRSRLDIGMYNFDLVREREAEFFQFLDSELEKVESFYKLKEDQAGKRLALLRDQLHEMRNRRTQELAEERRNRHQNGGQDTERGGDENDGNGNGDEGKRHTPAWIEPIKSKIFKPGPNSKALQRMAYTPVLRSANQDASRDYIRRPPSHEVPYRTAKRKLKLALQEFYRGLELLKSYALLNRTAFRKLNKKYDKAVSARPPYRYMTDKVNKSVFVTSDALDSHISAVEDLYARYFERGNHKIAAGKLRKLSRKTGDHSGSAFRNGLLIGTGLVFSIQGMTFGTKLLWDEDPILQQQTSYLMQIYGGYFLMLYLFIMFCIDCRIWTANKINYPFIFEFDTRHNLDWRQLAQFPSLFLLVFGLFIWLNFSRYGSPDIYLYYPVAMIAVTAVIIFLPAPILWHRSRMWFVYSHVSPIPNLIRQATVLLTPLAVSFTPRRTISCRIS